MRQRSAMSSHMFGWSRHPAAAARATLALALVLLVAVLLLAGSGSSSSRLSARGQGSTAGDGWPRALLTGRLWPGPDAADGTASLPQLMTWPASSATFAFSGSSSVTVLINGSLDALPEADRQHTRAMLSFPQSFFQFEIDGEPVGKEHVGIDAPELTWTHKGLSPGRHTLRVTKLSEARNGGAWLHSVSLAPGGRFLPPPDPPSGTTLGSGGSGTGGSSSGSQPRRILFLGDSYTVGMSNTGPPKCRKPNVAGVTDALLAYGPLTAGQLAADYQVVAWSGAAINTYSRWVQHDWPEQLRRAAAPRMHELFRMSDALDPASSYDHGSWVPQVVVLAAGTNDLHRYSLSAENQIQPGDLDPATPPTLQEWTAGYESLVRQVRSAYPAAHLIMMVWPLEVQLAGIKTLPQTAIYLQFLSAAFSRLQQAGIPDIHLLQLDGSGMNGSAFCTMHPDAPAHADVARQLTAFIRGALPWFAGGPEKQAAEGQQQRRRWR